MNSSEAMLVPSGIPQCNTRCWVIWSNLEKPSCLQNDTWIMVGWHQLLVISIRSLSKIVGSLYTKLKVIFIWVKSKLVTSADEMYGVLLSSLGVEMLTTFVSEKVKLPFKWFLRFNAKGYIAQEGRNGFTKGGQGISWQLRFNCESLLWMFPLLIRQEW